MYRSVFIPTSFNPCGNGDDNSSSNGGGDGSTSNGGGNGTSSTNGSGDDGRGSSNNGKNF